MSHFLKDRHGVSQARRLDQRVTDLARQHDGTLQIAHRIRKIRDVSVLSAEDVASAALNIQVAEQLCSFVDSDAEFDAFVRTPKLEKSEASGTEQSCEVIEGVSIGQPQYLRCERADSFRIAFDRGIQFFAKGLRKLINGSDGTVRDFVALRAATGMRRGSGHSLPPFSLIVFLDGQHRRGTNTRLPKLQVV